jgi:hypothetical protein
MPTPRKKTPSLKAVVTLSAMVSALAVRVAKAATSVATAMAVAAEEVVVAATLARKLAVKAHAVVVVAVKVAVMSVPRPSAWTLATLTPTQHRAPMRPKPWQALKVPTPNPAKTAPHGVKAVAAVTATTVATVLSVLSVPIAQNVQIAKIVLSAHNVRTTCSRPMQALTKSSTSPRQSWHKTARITTRSSQPTVRARLLATAKNAHVTAMAVNATAASVEIAHPAATPL